MLKPLLLILGLALTSAAPAQTTPAMSAKAPAQTAQSASNYTRTPTGFLMVLRPGDNVLQQLEQLAARENIPSATVVGIGFGHPTFGFWDAQSKTYAPQAFRDQEMASLTGSLAWKDGKPSLHLHGVGAGRDFTTHGGHLLALEVGTGTMELTVTVHDKKLIRATDPSTGANALQVK